MTRQSLLALGVAVLCAASARGTSTPPVALTPKNIGDHPRLSITAQGDGEGVRVSVSIAAKDAKTPPEVNGGYLIVKDGERLVCTCPVQPESAKHIVSFRFVIAERCLEKSQFSFTVATAGPEERKKLPSGGGWATYQFTPKAFVAAKEVPKDEVKPGEVKRPAKPREGRYVAYWLTRDPPDPKNTEYEPLLLLTRYSLEQLADDKELAFLLRDLPNAKPPAEALEAVALTVETYKKDSIWNPDGRPFKPARSLGGIDVKKRHVTANGVRYQYETCQTGDAVRLLEYPEGTIPIHRLHKPGAGPAQDQTFRAFRALLREQLNSELLPVTPPRVRAFVAYLGRNGIELVPGADRDEWWVVGHGQRHGPLEVKIHGFSPVASPKWMRLVLDNTSWAAELNAPARLAMSKTVALAGPDMKKPDAVKALEGKLLRLFRQYEAPTDVVADDRRVAKDQDALLAFLKAKGVELRSAENRSNVIQLMFTVGPDHDKNLLVGLSHIDPLPAGEEGPRPQIDIAIPSVVHRNWALFMVGGPGGNATDEYKAVWKKAEAAFNKYPGPDKAPHK